MNRLIQTLVFLALTPAAFAATTVIVGGKVHTVGPQGTLENATVLIEDGRIAAVGAKVELPAGATVIDATGKIVTPGLFSPYGQLGLVEVMKCFNQIRLEGDTLPDQCEVIQIPAEDGCEVTLGQVLFVLKMP